MHRRSNRIRAVLLAGACVAALGLAACGGDDETSATTDAGATGVDSNTDLDQARDEFIAGALESIAQNQDISDAKAECLRDELETRLSDDVLQELLDAGGTSPEALELAVAAGRACQGTP
jgi:hypothetical protein